MEYKDLMSYLKSDQLHTRMNTAQMIANKVGNDPDLGPYLHDIALALALADPNKHVRFNLAFALGLCSYDG